MIRNLISLNDLLTGGELISLPVEFPDWPWPGAKGEPRTCRMRIWREFSSPGLFRRGPRERLLRQATVEGKRVKQYKPKTSAYWPRWWYVSIHGQYYSLGLNALGYYELHPANLDRNEVLSFWGGSDADRVREWLATQHAIQGSGTQPARK